MARFTAIVASATTILSSAMASQFVMYTPGGDDTVVERIDPIINPGTFSGHVHQVFGANGLSPNMTYDSLQQSDCTTVGDASGAGNSADKSVYWHPSLYMEASDGSGYVRVPTNGHKMYYRDVGSSSDQKREPFEFPHGFRMVAGDMTMRAANSDSSHQGITQWFCHDGGYSGDKIGETGGFPDGVTDCRTYPWLGGSIHFPHCWNGDDFDQSNPTAHMSYPDGDFQGGTCPPSHPIRLPHIFQENFFDVHSVIDKVKPGSFVLAQGDDTGFGFHADMYSGWDDGAIPALLASCPYEYYGNEDVGACSAFKGFSTATADCSLSLSFKENVDTPAPGLPGCNPVSDVNPAPRMAVANIGSNSCASAPSNPSGYASSSASTASSSTPSSSSSAAAYQAPSYTTFLTSSATVATSAAAAVTSAAIQPAAYADGNVVWVTEIVTVWARDAEATPIVKPRHRHHHVRHNMKL